MFNGVHNAKSAIIAGDTHYALHIPVVCHFVMTHGCVQSLSVSCYWTQSCNYMHVLCMYTCVDSICNDFQDVLYMLFILCRGDVSTSACGPDGAFAFWVSWVSSQLEIVSGGMNVVKYVCIENLLSGIAIYRSTPSVLLPAQPLHRGLTL